MLLAVATVALLGPPGWSETHELPDAIISTLPVHVYERDGTRCVVTGGTLDTTDGLDRVMDAQFGPQPSRIRLAYDGVTSDDVTLAGAHATMRYGYVGTRVEVVFGACYGTGPAFAECERHLATLDIHRDPEPESPFGRIALVVGGVFAGVLALGLLARTLARRRDLRRAPELVDREEVTIGGVVRAIGGPLEAPLSGQPCVAHRSRARVFATDVAGKSFEPTDREVTRFVVDTPRGPIQIDDVALDITPTTVVGRDTPRQVAFRKRHLIPSGLTVDFDEIVIGVGQNVTLRGTVHVDADVASRLERGYRDGAPTLIKLVDAKLLRVW